MIAALADFHFLRPAWLWMLPAAFAIWWQGRRRADALRGWREQMDPELLQALVTGHGTQQDWRPYLLLAAWLSTIVAVAGPTWRFEPNPFASDAPPLMILLKADPSMLLSPPEPSRLERAHLKIADLANARKGQPMGLIAYAGSAHLVLPPTRDNDIVAKMAAEVHPDIMPQAGDRLDLAILEATKRLTGEFEGGTLLVVADSAQLDSQALSSLSMSDRMPPVQFLSLVDPDAPETKQLRDAARSLNASVQPLTVDDADVASIVDFAERRASRGLAGESLRWQEAGYWITPAIALIVALSFRRQETSLTEGPG